MRSLIHTIFLLIVLLLFSGCNKDDAKETPSECDQAVVISNEEFHSAPDDLLTIVNAEIKNDCLIINFGSSGCDGSTWVVKLIDSEAVAESYPPQRTLRLSLQNEELCDAYFTKEISFNIKELQVEGRSVILNIEEYIEPILYEY